MFINGSVITVGDPVVVDTNLGLVVAGPGTSVLTYVSPLSSLLFEQFVLNSKNLNGGLPILLCVKFQFDRLSLSLF